MFNKVWKAAPGLVIASIAVSGVAYAAPAGEGTGERQRFAGQVTAIGSNSLSLETRDGSAVTVAVNAETQYRDKGRNEKSFGDLVVGSVVGGVVFKQSDGSLLARLVVILPARTEYTGNGKITAVDEDEGSFHFTNLHGRKWEFYVDSSTAITTRKGASLTIADLQASQFAHVEARLRSDGKWWASVVKVRK